MLSRFKPNECSLKREEKKLSHLLEKEADDLEIIKAVQKVREAQLCFFKNKEEIAKKEADKNKKLKGDIERHLVDIDNNYKLWESFEENEIIEIYKEPLRDPKTAYGKLEEIRYKAEVELVERYQSFVAEILRLSLLGIVVFGFLYKNIFKDLNKIGLDNIIIKFKNLDPINLINIINIFRDPDVINFISKFLAAGSVISFGISAFCALYFRYFATEGVRYYIEALRFTPGKEEGALKITNKRSKVLDKRAKHSLDVRYEKIKRCRKSKLFAAVFFVAGGILVALALSLAMLLIGIG